MFDIGFAELLVIGVVGLLVIGPERLPSTIRTASLWLNRIRRGFNEIKQEVQQELHNDAVMQELRDAGQQLKEDTRQIGQDIEQELKETAQPLGEAPSEDELTGPGDPQQKKDTAND